MGRYHSIVFDWSSFLKHLQWPSDELAAAVAVQVHKDRRSDRSAHPSLPADETKLVLHISEWLSSEDWYAGLSADQMAQTDQLIALLFSGAAGALIGVQASESGADSMLVDYARGYLKVTAKGRHSRFSKSPSFQLDPMNPVHAFGSRPYRFPTWQPPSEEFNPFLCEEPSYLPSYSIHEPKEVAELLHAFEKVDLSPVAELELREEFCGFLKPIATACQTGKALYVWQDF